MWILLLRTQYVFSFLVFCFFNFRERVREGEKEGEKHLCERETSIGSLPYTPQGTEPVTQACALTGN